MIMIGIVNVEVDVNLGSVSRYHIQYVRKRCYKYVWNIVRAIRSYVKWNCTFFIILSWCKELKSLNLDEERSKFTSQYMIIADYHNSNGVS